ncbi:MAG: PRC-barrel domain-containing protein [Xanthobacteraceae bacterium]
MIKLAPIAIVTAAISTAAFAQPAKINHAIPANSATVTNWYKQSVYDPKDSKIGDIADVLVDKSGRIDSLIVAVGGFLGAGEKDVSVPFDAVRVTSKDNNKWYLVMNTTKDQLKEAPGFTYDKESTTWMPNKK